jgi:hypothetical protein
MASESLNTLLKSIDEANTKISNRLGLLDTHITAIITAGKALLAKIKAGTLLPDQIAQIRGKLNSLREKTLANVGSKNTRIQELEELFTQLLGASPPNTATPNAGNLGLGNIGNYFSSARNSPKNYKVARGEPNRNSENLLNYGNVGNLFSSAGDAPKNYTVARGTPNRNSKNLLKYGNVGDLFSSAPEAPKNYKVATGQNYENAKKANVERQRTRELERLASQQANSGNLFEPLNPANGNPAQVLSKINAIPDSKSASTNNAKIRVQNIVEAIQAVRVFLQVQTEINDGLLDYLNQRYSVDPRSLNGEMGAKHKPVLKYIVSLAGDLASFTEKIQRPIGIFPKSDIQVRIDILTSVIAKLPEENSAELREYMYSLHRVNQSGGKRNTRCGCGLKGGRRTRKATRKRRNS